MELLNKFFQSTCSPFQSDDPLSNPPSYSYKEALTDFEIKDEDVKLKIKNLKVNKAAGPDQISPLVLSKAADVLALPVAELFRRSLASEQIPEDWKKATVAPIRQANFAYHVVQKLGGGQIKRHLYIFSFSGYAKNCLCCVINRNHVSYTIEGVIYGNSRFNIFIKI
jgi:hypothetical protein